MKARPQRTARALRTMTLALVALGSVTGPSSVAAQRLNDIRATDAPLTLASRGSFYVGGQEVERSAVEIGSFGPDDRITVDQMYVEYMKPAQATGLPVVMVHGATLSGKTYDTTPDGRMGWYEYFVRKNHPVYIVDQVGRARSGFDQSAFNSVRAGDLAPEQQPNMLRLGDRFGVWTNFRIGPHPGEAFPDTQFPVEAAGEMSRQSVPDLLGASRAANPTWGALSELAKQLDGAVLLTHSQSGPYPLQAALIDPSGIRSMVMVEPGTCNAKTLTDEDITRLASTPMLILFGDHLTSQTNMPGPTWEERYRDCQALKARIDAVGGDVTLMTTDSLGVRGNTHMMMMDRNNLQIADSILAWIDEKDRH